MTSKAVVEIISKTTEYLQPNPATRAKLTMLSTVSKIRGQVKSPGYPQPEGLLGECMTKYGQDMGNNTSFGENAAREPVSISVRSLKQDRTLAASLFFCIPGGALVDFGESMLRLAEVKDSLDIDVKQNFIDPLQTVADKDIKDIQVNKV